jgi:hypothetical protein
MKPYSITYKCFFQVKMQVPINGKNYWLWAPSLLISKCIKWPVHFYDGQFMVKSDDMM